MWKIIPDNEGYEVSDDGHVRNKVTGRILKNIVNSDGYHVVSLSNRKQHRVSRLVLLAFVGPCPEGMNCRHIDNDRTNNHLSNLAWGTCLDQHNDRVAAGHCCLNRSGRPKGAKNKVPA